MRVKDSIILRGDIQITLFREALKLRESGMNTDALALFITEHEGTPFVVLVRSGIASRVVRAEVL